MENTCTKQPRNVAATPSKQTFPDCCTTVQNLWMFWKRVIMMMTMMLAALEALAALAALAPAELCPD
jgi:hypothetical protein